MVPYGLLGAVKNCSKKFLAQKFPASPLLSLKRIPPFAVSPKNCKLRTLILLVDKLAPIPDISKKRGPESSHHLVAPKMKENAMSENIIVFDCDGHIIESIPEMVPFLDEVDREIALRPSRNRQGVFAGLDAIHYPRNVERTGEVIKPSRPRVDASEYRKGSGEDWVEFLNKAGVAETVLFPSEGLSVGFFQQADYAVRVCRAFNDYVYERYRKVDPRLHPMGLIAMQDVNAAVKELRRLVLDLKLPGAMLPSRGLPLHLGHDYYWPVYEEAANLGCVLGIHGGSSLGLGADSFTDPWAARTLRHPVPLALAFVSFVYHGVFDRYRDLRVGFFEGGCAWILLLKDRMDRDDSIYTTPTGKHRSLNDYLSSGQVLVGCEGNEEILPYVINQVGAECFSYASDYPHEVDLVAAKQMIHETIERADMTHAEKALVLGENARRFFRL
jgi:predicted TIM-barrel fold metal-dependent hydrolase